MDEGGRGVLHRCQIDIARRLAACALNFQPRETAVHRRLIHGRRRIDWFAVGPHPFVQLSHSSLSACRISASFLARTSADCIAKMLAMARALPSSLFRALRSPPERGVGWYFGAIRASIIQTTRTGEAAGDYSSECQQPSTLTRSIRDLARSHGTGLERLGPPTPPDSLRQALASCRRRVIRFWV
jgi:hypothetical protein